MKKNVFENENASIDELTGAYSSILNLISQTEADRKANMGRLVKLQSDEITGKKMDRKAYDEAKSAVSDCDYRLIAARENLDLLRQRLVVRIPEEAKQRTAELHAQFDEAMTEHQKRFRAYLTTMAQAVAMKERFDSLKGGIMTRTGWVSDDYPDLKFEPDRLENDDRTYFAAEVEKARKANPAENPTDTQKDEISNELSRLEKVLEADPEAEADKLIRGLMPKEPAPEKAPEPRKTSVYVERYDRLQTEPY